MRQGEVFRKTGETTVQIFLDLDGTGKYENGSGVGFLDHMLDLFARHGRFDLKVAGQGDTHVDYHHMVEDVGISLGRAFYKALEEKKGICRYGSIMLPMDETLVMAAVDISGRPYLNFDVTMTAEKVGGFDTQLVEEFFHGFARSLGATIHLKQFYGSNAHHIIEACFKAFGRAMAEAVAIDPEFADEIPSTKGVL